MKKIKKTNDQFKKEVFDLVGDEYTFMDPYINNKTKLNVRHNDCGSIYKVRPDLFISSGNRCPVCSNRKKDDQFKKEVFNLVGDEYSFLESYQKNNIKISVKHNTCGNIYKVDPIHFLMGNRCPICSKISTTKSRESFEKEVFNLVGDEYTVIGTYINNKEKIKFRHNICNTEWETLPTNFISLGTRCPACNGNTKKTDIDFKREIHDLVGDEYTVIGTYINSGTKIDIQHSACGKVYAVRPDDFKRGRRCPYCSLSGTSQQEKEVLTFIKTFYKGSIIERYKDIQEIDIYLPELKIGIEYDGLYWHSDEYKDKKYHINKTEYFIKKGIRIIHIFEDEWLYKRDIVESKIRHILKYNTNTKIYARKCSVHEITTKEKNDFLDKYHIQGADKSSIKLGLYFNNNLVSVMTFGTARVSLGHKDINTIELIRFASDNKYIIIGAFGKILSYYKENYTWSSIITYADLRWSTENSVYYKSGFNLVGKSKPNYWYFDDDKIRRHRYSFNKQKIKKLFPGVYNDKLTEFEIMNKTRYRRIYDCGNLVYELRKEKE